MTHNNRAGNRWSDRVTCVLGLMACGTVNGLKDGGNTFEVVTRKVEELEELESFRNSRLVANDASCPQGSRHHQKNFCLFHIISTLEFHRWLVWLNCVV